MSKDRRSRLFFGQRNYEFETHDENKVKKVNAETEDKWREKVINELFSIPDFEYLALIFHDRDILDEEHNTKKGLHCHFVVRYSNPRFFNSILEATRTEKRNLETSSNQVSVLRYLTHTTEQAIKDKKTRYNVSEIYLKTNPKADFVTGEDLEKWYRFSIAGKSKENSEVTENFVKELSFKISVGQLKPFQARDVLINEFGEVKGHSIYRKEKEKFKSDYDDFLDSKKRSIMLNGKKLATVYIEGSSSVGKSFFAKDLANEINERDGRDVLDVYFAAAKSKNANSYDWIAKYSDEHITIFDDLDPFSFGFTDFLSTFETKKLVDVSSRYKNKIWFSEYAIITKSTDIADFVDAICDSELRYDNKSTHANTRYQVQRRISLVIKIESRKLTISQFEKNGTLSEKAVFTYRGIRDFWNTKKRQEIIQKCLSII